MRNVVPRLTQALLVAGAAALLAACGDDSSSSAAGGGGGAAVGSGGAPGAGGATSTSASGGGEGPGTAGTSTTTGTATTSGTGGGGGATAVLGPWPSTTERCDGALDQDADGLVDEDCPDSLFGGVFVPAGVGVVDPLVFDRIELDTARDLAVLQTYRSTSEAGAANAKADLAGIWARGATPHLNVEPLGYDASQLEAAGDDPELAADVEAMATAVAESLGEHPGHALLLTFAAEMNGDWTTWGCLPAATFISFYRWAHDVFDVALAAHEPPIDPRRVRWVFGPNNVSSAGCGAPSDYYPGHDVTDYLGMSAYRSGTQSVASAVLDPAHMLLDDVSLSPALQADRFIVLQTGTRIVAGDDRDQWIRDLFADLTSDPVFRGAIYFDDADWTVAASAAGGVVLLDGYAGLVDALTALPPADGRLEGTFDPYFWDVPTSDPSYPEIQSLRAAGLTSGCGAAPPRFCPEAQLTRADAAVLLGRAFAIEPDAGASPIFDDVDADAPSFGFVQALASAGVLEGCSPTSFCPGEAIARGDLARALVRLTTAPLPPVGQPPFGDLDTVAEDGAIQVLGNLELVDGCAPASFCPAEPTSRDVGARWIVRVAGVPEAPRLGG